MQVLRNNKFLLLTMLALGIVYLLSRLLTLSSVPIFTDEAIYLRWAQIAKNDASWRFISLTDGKQPLYIWITMVFMEYVKDPLLAGRLVSVAAGFLTALGLFLLGNELFKKKWVGVVSSLCYVIWPFSLIYDRMALYDSLVGTFCVFGLYLTILLIRTLRLDIALVLGFVTGAAVLNKTNGFFTIYLLPFGLILFDWKKKLLHRRIIRYVLLSAVVVTITYLFYTILRLSPFFYIIEQKNGLFVYPLKEWITHPFLQLWSNTESLVGWLLSYMGVPYLLMVVLSFVLSKKYVQEKVLLVTWFFIPFIALILFGKQLYPRYILFMTLSLLPLVAYSIVLLCEKRGFLAKMIVGSAILLYSVVSFSMILFNPVTSPIPKADKGQFLTGWPSGYGIKESVAFFTKRAQNHDITIATAGTFGLLPYSYELYLVTNPRVRIEGFWPVTSDISPELLSQAKSREVYVVFYQDCSICPEKGIAPTTWPLSQVYQYKKLEPSTYFTVYRVTP